MKSKRFFIQIIEDKHTKQRKTLLRNESRRNCLKRFFLIQLIIFTILTSIDVWAAENLNVGILEEPRTLNIWNASDRWSRKILENIYNPLYIRGPKNLKLVPWLAESKPFYDKTTLSYTIKLRSVKWSDGSEFTSEDIAFTGNLIKLFQIPRHYNKWNFIKKIETPDKRTVKFFLKEPKAIFQTRTLITPIIQKKAWEKAVQKARATNNPLEELLNYQIEAHVGTGPFVFKEWKKGAYIVLKKNEYFFGRGQSIDGYHLGPYIDGIRFSLFNTTEDAISALKKGTIDFFWWGIPPDQIPILRKKDNIQIFSNERSALYYLGFNMRKPPFHDVNFRHAVATLIDKDFIIKKVLNGNGVKMDSIVPPGNRQWYFQNVTRYGEGLKADERIQKAHEILAMPGIRGRYHLSALRES